MGDRVFPCDFCAPGAHLGHWSVRCLSAAQGRAKDRPAKGGSKTAPMANATPGPPGAQYGRFTARPSFSECLRLGGCRPILAASGRAIEPSVPTGGAAHVHP